MATSTLVEMRRLLGALTEDERAAVARLVLRWHLELLTNGWPDGHPHQYVSDFEIGEISAIEHCESIAAQLGSNGNRDGS